MADPQWVLGISIDDELTWAIAPVVPEWKAFRSAYPRLDFPHGKFSDFKQLVGDDPGQALDLGQEIRELIGFLQTTEVGDLLTRVVSIGVSTIGITDHRSHRLIDLRRKRLVRNADDDYIVDFYNTFSDVLSGPQFAWRKTQRLSVQNDATAKCLAYYRFQDQLRRHQTLCLLNLSVGINIGLANGFGPLSSSLFHPELGHAYPFLEHDDKARDFKLFGGCPVHDHCYESVLSSKRIEGQWGQSARKLPAEHEAWKVLSSYVGQLCWIAALATSPDIIYLGGPTSCQPIVEWTRRKFTELNNGEARQPYLKYDTRRIRLAPEFPVESDGSITDISGLMGALELGRRCILRRDRPFASDRA